MLSGSAVSAVGGRELYGVIHSYGVLVHNTPVRSRRIPDTDGPHLELEAAPTACLADRELLNSMAGPDWPRPQHTDPESATEKSKLHQRNWQCEGGIHSPHDFED